MNLHSYCVVKRMTAINHTKKRKETVRRTNNEFCFPRHLLRGATLGEKRAASVSIFSSVN
jgi:hypothetical protein